MERLFDADSILNKDNHGIFGNDGRQALCEGRVREHSLVRTHHVVEFDVGQTWVIGTCDRCIASINRRSSRKQSSPTVVKFVAFEITILLGLKGQALLFRDFVVTSCADGDSDIWGFAKDWKNRLALRTVVLPSRSLYA